jgi:hypothetical protein
MGFDDRVTNSRVRVSYREQADALWCSDGEVPSRATIRDARDLDADLAV